MPKFEGCKTAYEFLEENPGSKVVLYGVLPQTIMYMIPSFQKLMIEHAENVRYFRIIPRGFDNFSDRDPFKKPNHVSPAIRLVVGRKLKTDRMSRMKHHMGNADRGSPLYSAENVIMQGRELGLSGTDDEVAHQIRSYCHEETPPQFNERLGGIYCDVEGTLLIDGKLNNVLREDLEAMSHEKPVTLWTGGDYNDVAVSSFMPSDNIEWPVLSKQWFKGCTAEYIIDDMPQDEFEKEYGIKAETFWLV